MPFVDTAQLEPGEPRPGWHDRYFRSATMSFAYFTVDEGSSIHEHAHPEEEVWHIIEGSLEVTLDGQSRVLGPGHAAVVPPNVPHAVRALSGAKVIIANHPARGRVGGHR